MIYLDNASTTGWKPEPVHKAVSQASRNLCVNAGRGSYALARDASHMLDDLRADLLSLAGLQDDYRVILTGSATVSLNELILGLSLDEWSNVYVSPFEHNAVMRPLHAMAAKSGATLRVLPFDPVTQQPDLQAVEGLFVSHPPDYLFLSLVSNVTGLRLPVRDILLLARPHGCRVILDGAQAFGAISEDYASLQADALVFAGHKTLYGPYGSAGLFLRRDWPFPCGLYGGTGSASLSLSMPDPDSGGWEPGSLNMTALAGLKAAVQWLKVTGISTIEQHEHNLALSLRDALLPLSSVHLYTPPSDFMTGILAFSVDGYMSQEVGEILDSEFDIAVRTGYQCAPLVHDLLGTQPFHGVIRASVGYQNTEDDIQSLVCALQTL